MILHKKEKNWCDNREVHIFFPWAGRRRKCVDIMESVEGTEYGFKLQTECTLFREPEIYWQFRLRILGFGIGIFRQYSY
jgi:hypothetical protein